MPGPINGSYGYIPVEEVAEARNPVDIHQGPQAGVGQVRREPAGLGSEHGGQGPCRPLQGCVNLQLGFKQSRSNSKSFDVPAVYGLLILLVP